MAAHAPHRPRLHPRRGGARLGLTLALGVVFVAGTVLGLAHVRPDLKERLWERFTQGGVAQRPDTIDIAPDELDEGWIRIRVGGRPIETAEPQESPDIPALGGSDFVLVVQPSQTLRRIALEHYRRADAELLDALARYNELEDPDDLLAGSQLRLPELSRLGNP